MFDRPQKLFTRHFLWIFLDFVLRTKIRGGKIFLTIRNYLLFLYDRQLKNNNKSLINKNTYINIIEI